jgi:hypothetical protein
MPQQEAMPNVMLSMAARIRSNPAKFDLVVCLTL